MKAILLLHTGESHAVDGRPQPITRRGQVDALRLGEIIQARELFPDRILTAPAPRARQAIEILCRRTACPQVLACDELTAAGPPELLRLVARLPDGVGRVMIVSHSPGLKHLLHALTGWKKSFPVSGLAYLVLPICSWREILELESGGQLVELWRAGQPPSSFFASW
jgi:phosphohistidine phosphatase